MPGPRSRRPTRFHKPAKAATRGALNSFILASFSYWHVYVMAIFVILCFALALWPTAGRLKLGLDSDQSEFPNFSWFSMMFGAGIGIGMLTFATAEPMSHFGSKPATITGETSGSTAGNVRDADIRSFTHWGLAAWASYAIVGLSLAFFSYRRGLPLTIRSALTPLFGDRLAGPIGHVVDIVAVVATVLGVAQTLGFGVDRFVSGLVRIGLGYWLQTTTADGTVTSPTAGIIVAPLVIMGASTLSALSGVGKGIKWLSNINMGLSFFLLAFFLIFGPTFFGLSTLFEGIFDHLFAMPANMFTVYSGFPLDAFAANAPAAIASLPAEDLAAVHAAATNPWGSMASFTDGLPAAAASLPQETLAAAYAAGTEGRLSGWQGGRVAGWLDHLLLGLVDCLCALRRRVPCPHLEGADDPRIRAARDDRPVGDVLCLVRAGGRHGDRPRTAGRGRGRDPGCAEFGPVVRHAGGHAVG